VVSTDGGALNCWSERDRICVNVPIPDPQRWACRFSLDPNPAQQNVLRSHCGAQRFAYNWGLSQVKENLGQRATEKIGGIDAEALSPALAWSAYALRRTWNQAKDAVAPWWSENSKEAYSSGLAHLATALGNWKDSTTGNRKGPKVRFPRFKDKRAGLCCRFTTGAFGLATIDRRHVKLPRIGIIRTHESTRKLARHVERGTARIRSATVSYQRGRWFVSFSVQITRTDPPATRPDAAIGVDLGIKSLAVLSTGEVIANPKHLERAQRALRRWQRQAARRIGPDRRTKTIPSNRWRSTQARITRLHTAVANARHDGLHKLTTRLAGTFGTIVIEDLAVSGMLKNRRLARHIAGVGWAEFRRQVDYKTRWRGGRLTVADRWFPSSKTCSGCGVVKAKVRLSERIFRCDLCGLVLDRDLNAARNLAHLVGEITGGTSSPSCGATVNEPDGNPCQTRTERAAGTATGRPGSGGTGQRRHRKVTAT
jgi:putative transposase